MFGGRFFLSLYRARLVSSLNGLVYSLCEAKLTSCQYTSGVDHLHLTLGNKVNKEI